jgi:hypothetical protein
VALPPLDAMFNANGTAYAAGPVPRRFGVFWWGNGARLNLWTPDAEGPGWTPKEELAPLAAVKDYVSVVSGMAMTVLNGNTHNSGRRQMLTGTEEYASNVYSASVMPSVDQVVARQWNAPTQFRSLEILVSRRGFENSTARGEVAQAGAGSYVPMETSPGALFTRVFGGGALPTATGDGAAKVKAARQSVLDTIRADATRLSARLGATDKRRLADHLDGIRAIETRLQAAPAAVTCGALPARPTLGASTDLGHEDLEGINKAMADLLALALACDLSRVFTYALSQAQSDTVFWQVGLNEGLHTISHQPIAQSGDKVHKAVVFTMQQLAYLVGRLKAIPEGAGNVLDSLCLYCTTEVAEGNSHSCVDVPMLVIGRGGGALRSGVHYRSKSRENVNKLLFTLLKSMGLPITTFGGSAGQAAGRTSDTLSAILV